MKVWVLEVAALTFAGNDDRSGCTVWQLAPVPEYLIVTSSSDDPLCASVRTWVLC